MQIKDLTVKSGTKFFHCDASSRKILVVDHDLTLRTFYLESIECGCGAEDCSGRMHIFLIGLFMVHDSDVTGLEDVTDLAN
jgi:hypothetical protein